MLFSLPARADDGLVDAYLDVSIGHSTLSPWNAEDFDSSVSNTKTKDTDAALRLAIGFGVTKNFTIEFGHNDLGEVVARGTSDGSLTFWAPGPVSVAVDVGGYDLGVIAHLPVSEGLSVVGRAGVFMWTQKTSFHNTKGSSANRTATDGGSDPFYGIGAQFVVSKWLTFRGDFTRYASGNYDIDS